MSANFGDYHSTNGRNSTRYEIATPDYTKECGKTPCERSQNGRPRLATAGAVTRSKADPTQAGRLRTQWNAGRKRHAYNHDRDYERTVGDTAAAEQALQRWAPGSFGVSRTSGGIIVQFTLSKSGSTLCIAQTDSARRVSSRLQGRVLIRTR